MRARTIDGVERVIRDPDVTPESMHVAWCDHMLMTGWNYSRRYNREQKLHPSLCHYSALPELQRVRDHLFVAMAKFALAKLERKARAEPR